MMSTPASVRRAGWLAGLVLALAHAAQAAPPVQAEAWLTTGDRTRLLAPQRGLAFGEPGRAPLAITVDPSRRYQAMTGFGATITDASAWLIRHRMSPGQRDALMAELFGRGEGGVGFDFVRLTIGASDFSRTHYSLDDMPPGQSDPGLARFSIEPQRAELLPVVQQALRVNPGLQIMASPWSAPGWMKTTDSLIQGRLRTDRHADFARYLVRYVESYRDEGVPIFALTVQNEPHFEPKDYPGMRLESAERAAFIGRHLGPLLAERGLRTQIIEWDHNWSDPAAPMAVLADPVAQRYVSGVGWHCYEGHVQVQAAVHDAFPDKDTWFTECSGGEWAPRWPETLPWMVRHIVIGATRGWARGVLMWNLALDENHGPHLGGCNDCRGVVTIDSRTGEVTRNLEYYALAHASKFVRPGARRIDSTAAIGPLESVAFQNTDGSVALLVLNGGAEAQRFGVRWQGRELDYALPPRSVVTLVWPG